MFDKKAYQREWHLKHREEIRKKNKIYYETHREEIRTGQKAKHLRVRYGLTLTKFDDMLKSQDNRCAICNRMIRDKNCHIDHDHKTGKIRGLLCNKCNMGIGLFGDNPNLLIKATKYLFTRRSI